MRKHLPILLLSACAVAFVFGVVRLIQFRFERGDVYPAYSSLRADPLGTMAFYESLATLPGISTRRDFSSSDRLPEEPQTVYLHLAGSRYEWRWVSKDVFHEIQNFLARGDRLVITFFPQTTSRDYRYFDEGDQTNSVKSARADSKKMPSEKPVKKTNNADDDEAATVSLEDEWGFDPGFRSLAEAGKDYAPAIVRNQTDLPLPQTLDWHSGLVFTNWSSAWRVIYARGTNAVVIERQFGKGSVVLLTDSYLVSNEAMATDPHADLLAWLVGASKNVVFDEAHLGVVESSGVVALMRKYRLHGLAAGLLILAGLFIWKNSTSLVPPLPEPAADAFVTGKDSGSGFVNLLRRSIAPRDLLATCFAEWKKTSGPAGKITPARRLQAEAVFQTENSLPPKERNPVAAYQNIANALGNRNSKL